MKSMRNVGTLLRRRRQRNRAIGEGAQIGDHVGALAVFRNAGKAHRGARNKALGIGDELVEVVKGPLATLGLHRRREIEPAPLALLFADDAVKIRADAIGTVFLEGMAGGGFLYRRCPLLRSGRPQTLFDWDGTRSRGDPFSSSARSHLLQSLT